MLTLESDLGQNTALLTNYEIWAKFYDLSEPQFLHLYNRNSNCTYFLELFEK